MTHASFCPPPLTPSPIQVPITLYFMTHAYFCLYHALANLLIRRARAAVARHGVAAQVRAPAGGQDAQGLRVLG